LRSNGEVLRGAEQGNDLLLALVVNHPYRVVSDKRRPIAEYPGDGDHDGVTRLDANQVLTVKLDAAASRYLPPPE